MHAELRELRALIEQRFGEYNAATDRYLVRMGALSAYLAANGEATPAGLKG